MVQDQKARGVSASCPRCGKLHSHATLGGLTKAVQRCVCGKVTAKTLTVWSDTNLARPRLPLVVHIPLGIQSQNKTTYAHWTAHHRDKTRWLDQVGVSFAEWKNMRLLWSRWRIERVYKPPKREFDFGNLVGGAKPLVDCLTEHGVIFDDSPRFFTCDYSQYKGDANKTIITLLEYADERPSAYGLR